MNIIERAGRVLCGDRWKTGLARLLGVSARQVARWAAEPERMPYKRWKQIYQALLKHDAEVVTVISAVVSMGSAYKRLASK